MFFGFCFIDRGFMTAPEFRLLNVLPRTGWLSGVFWQHRLPDSVSAYPFFFLRRKKNSKRKSCKGDSPLTPAAGRDTTTAWGSSGRIQYRSHNADRSKFRLLNVLPRTFLGFPSRGSQGWGRGVRLTGQTGFAPNTETFSAVHNISVSCCSHPARSPGGLGGRSRIEFIVSPLSRRRHNESHFAAQSPERSFFF